MKQAIVLLLGVLLISGCAVFMAMHGKRDVSIGALQIGQDRAIVLANLGQPTRTAATENSRVDVFELQRGNSPSVGRALAHGALDFLTFGLWEIIGTPIEAMQGSTYILSVEYDKEDKVKKVITGESRTEGSM